ncbi:hypothetical protein NWF34_09765 [Gordonia sp. GONU]|uniref:hypothetical protein n=1 Tax=Gordonia sp. GONU TaxID=2972949 RepID=UPI0021AD3331|nr:hypothetical protein [Gordonia sp. GONU]MCR8897235.1 hypothetical protein [Gordonia sp. GONU]
MAESPQGSSPSDPQDGRRFRFRWNQHIGRTSVRISTTILFAVFIVCCVLYGYTSQRYGVVAPEPPRPAPKTSQVVDTPVYEEPVPSTFSETTSGSPSGSSTSEPGIDGGTEGGTRSTSTPSTTRPTIPGLPGVEIPQFGAPTPTTPVPTR